MTLVRIFYILILFGAAAFYIFYLDNLSLYLLLFLALIPIVTGVMLLLSKKKVSFSIKSFQQSYTRGTSIPILISMSNKSIVPFSMAAVYVECTNKLTSSSQLYKVNTSIFAENTQILRLEIAPEHCGIIQIKIKRVDLYDLMHLFRSKIRERALKNTDNSCNILISPEIFPLNIELTTATLVNYESDVFSKNKSGDDPSEIFDMHEYKPGDKLNRVHWKLTAKLDEFFIKDYSLPINDSICLIFDSRLNTNRAGGRSYEAFDVCMEAMFSVSAYLSDMSVPHSVIYLDNETEKLEKFNIDDPDVLSTAVSLILKNGYSDSEAHSAIEMFLGENITGKQYRIVYFTGSQLTDEEMFELSDFNQYDNVTVMLASSEDRNPASTVKYAGLDVKMISSGKIAECIEYLKL